MPRSGQLSAEPRYTIQSAAAACGVEPVTLRMWERRYGVVQPARSRGNYRLYSERDIALLRWLKHDVDGGRPIRLAAADLKRRLKAGDSPPALPSLRARRPAGSVGRVVRDLFSGLTSADEPRARAVLSRAEEQTDLDTLCLQILTPCLVEIGEAWHRGEIRISQEHYASGFLRAYLLRLYQAYPLRRGAPRVFVGCASSEQHEIGALMVALFLRRGGCRVDYLGANLDMADLVGYVRDQRPALVALSAATEGPALALERSTAGLERLRPRPLVGFGGRAFNLDTDLRTRPRGVFLGEDAALGAATALRMLLKKA
ncbi:MAG TPA: cobalamin B12-binding domain-containing protein [Anaerolineales bacterium]|nr:cobalamin B12-binding domain-containing protein [Anaerolineales bacterium]